MPRTSLHQTNNRPTPTAANTHPTPKFINGFPARDWILAKATLVDRLRHIAANHGVISYRDAAGMLVHIKLHENDFIFHLLLTEISTEEHQAGRGMLTSCIIQHHGNGPGNGYYDLGKKLKKYFTTQTKAAFWISEHERVFHANRKFLGLPPKLYR